jgi:hypothetical protein
VKDSVVLLRAGLRWGLDRGSRFCRNRSSCLLFLSTSRRVCLAEEVNEENEERKDDTLAKDERWVATRTGPAKQYAEVEVDLGNDEITNKLL